MRRRVASGQGVLSEAYCARGALTMQCDRLYRNVRIAINLDAIAHNVRCCRQLADGAQVFAVIKADAYGHGAVEILPALSAIDGIAVVNVAEALTIRSHRPHGDILVLQGAQSFEELKTAVAANLSVVVHHAAQIDMLGQLDAPDRRCWLKIDTGMGRLGFSHHDIDCVRRQLAIRGVQVVGVLSHLACADDRQSAATDQQIQNFTDCMAGWSVPPVCSMANSAALLSRADTLFDWVRPGIMLYGVSPFARETGVHRELQPAMRVDAPVIAVREHSKGQGIGYGATFICQAETRVAMVGIGYGDGYPRAAATGTPVEIGGRICPLLGRVSMDSIAVDVSELDAPVSPGDRAVLWGSDSLPVEAVAESVGVIPYELLCTIRGERTWVKDG